MAIRPMKWHIYNNEHQALFWNGLLLDFDTEESAKRFIDSYVSQMFDNPEDYYKTFGVYFAEDIVYMDDGYLDGTHLIVKFSDEMPDGYLESADD